MDKLIERINVSYEIEKSGTYKNASNCFTPLTPEQKKMLQEVTDDCYQQFVTEVANKRGLALNTAEQWANGRVFTGNQALKLHLIDEIGSEHNARQKIKELALIERDIEWIHPTYPSWINRFFTQESCIGTHMATLYSILTTPPLQLKN